MIKQKKNQINIPLAFDYKFKKVFGDNDGIERLEALIALYFNISYKEVHGNITILNGEKRKNKRNEKGGALDVYLKLELQSGATRIDLEVSDRKLSQSIIERNIMYGAYNLATQLQKRQSYSEIDTTIIICFDKDFLDEKEEDNEIIDEYSMRNKRSNQLTDKLQFHHINIEKCYTIWYNKSIEKFSEYEQNIIRFASLLYITKRSEFKKCLGGISMDKKIKKNIENVNFALDEDDELNMWWYDAEKDRELKRQAMLHDEIEYEKKKAREEGHALGHAEGREEGRAEGRTEGRVEGLIETAKNMLQDGVDVQTIVKYTNLSIDEINKLKSM